MDNHVYDDAGNATTSWSVSGLPYNTDNQRTGTGYAYDGNGNPTTWKGVSGNQYDAENRLTSYGSLLIAGYNGDRLRASKQTPTGNTWFMYDGYDIVCELDSAGIVIATNTFGTNGLVSRHTSGGSVFYAFDPSANVAQRVDSSGNVISSDLYDAFGNRPAGSSTDPNGFAGKWGCYTDIETGLVCMTHRYYDPTNGRFLTRDPIGYRGGINLYAYVNNDPVTRADPEGLLWPGYANFCGPGHRPGARGPVVKPDYKHDLDSCCQAHDNAWTAKRVGFIPDQLCHITACTSSPCPSTPCTEAFKADDALCGCAGKARCPISDWGCMATKGTIGMIFCGHCSAVGGCAVGGLGAARAMPVVFPMSAVAGCVVGAIAHNALGA